MGEWRSRGVLWMAVLLRYVQFSLEYTGPARDVLSPTGATAYHQFIEYAYRHCVVLNLHSLVGFSIGLKNRLLPKTNAPTDRVDRNWTKSGGKAP